MKSLSVTVTSPLSAAISSCVRPSGNVTLIVTTGAYAWATPISPISNTATRLNGKLLRVIGPFGSCVTSPPLKTRSLPLRRDRYLAVVTD
jgi:hypothetical protein